MSINPIAGAGFAAGAEVYERGRPSYPAAAVARLVEQLAIGPDSIVVDLAAGTGKFTRLLLPAGARLVIAAEPVEAMRAQLRALLPQLPVLGATAEAVPLGTGTADAVTVAQAFHWFDPSRAMQEIARVLRPGGGLGLVWNERDERVPWVAQLGEVIRWNVHMPYRVGTDWRSVVDASGLFTPMQVEHLEFEQDVDVETLVHRMASTSYVAAMPAEKRDPILDRVREVVAGFPPRFSLPYVTDVYWCRRLRL